MSSTDILYIVITALSVAAAVCQQLKILKSGGNVLEYVVNFLSKKLGKVNMLQYGARVVSLSRKLSNILILLAADGQIDDIDTAELTVVEDTLTQVLDRLKKRKGE